MPAPHHLFFCRPDALPDAEPTESKHWRQTIKHVQTLKKTNDATIRIYLGFYETFPLCLLVGDCREPLRQCGGKNPTQCFLLLRHLVRQPISLLRCQFPRGDNVRHTILPQLRQLSIFLRKHLLHKHKVNTCITLPTSCTADWKLQFYDIWKFPKVCDFFYKFQSIKDFLKNKTCSDKMSRKSSLQIQLSVLWACAVLW